MGNRGQRGIAGTLSTICLLVSGCAQVNVSPSSTSETSSTTHDNNEQSQAEGDAASPGKPAKTVTVTRTRKPAKTVTVTKKAERPANNSTIARPKVGPMARDIIEKTSNRSAVFPVTSYEAVTNETQIVSSGVPDWLTPGRVRDDDNTEFHVDDIQLLIGVRKARFDDKRGLLANRARLWRRGIWDVTYEKVTAKGCVLSGIKDGYIFYEVFEVHGNSDFYGAWMYPASRKSEMDPVIKVFFDNFKSGHV